MQTAHAHLVWSGNSPIYFEECAKNCDLTCPFNLESWHLTRFTFQSVGLILSQNPPFRSKSHLFESVTTLLDFARQFNDNFKRPEKAAVCRGPDSALTREDSI